MAKAVRIERRGRDVYIMGAANVGKSAFVRCAGCQMIALERATLLHAGIFGMS